MDNDSGRNAMKPKRIMIGLLIVSAVTTSVWALEEGDPAPALSIERWVLGEPVNDVGQTSDHIYVVAFWATWSRPATENLLELSKVQNDLKNSNVVVIAISAESAKKVEGFVQTHPKRKSLNIRIAVDDDQNTTIVYMKAAGRGPLPHVFVVNKEGIIAWQGHPLAVRPVLEQIIEGTFKIRKKADQTTAEEIDPGLTASLAQAAEEGNWRQAVTIIDQIVKRYPELPVVQDYLAQKFMILYERLRDYTAAEDFAQYLLKNHQDKALALNGLAWALLARGSFENLENRWPEIAHQAAKKAVDASNGEIAAILDTYARSLYLMGYVETALDYQRKAVRQLRADIDHARSSGSSPETIMRMNDDLHDLQAALDYYKEIAEVRKSLKP